MSIRIACFALSFDQDVVNTRQRAKLIAEKLGFKLKEQTSICTAVSEAARNCMLYANGGEVDFCVQGNAPEKWLSITFKDQGPGITNLDDVLNGRFQSSTGLGKGILGCQRLMPDHFSIETKIGHGTTVILGKRLPAVSQSFSNDLQLSIYDALREFNKESPLEQIRQQSETLLTAKEVSQQNMLEGMIDGCLRINILGNIIETNNSYINKSGYSREELVGMNISDLESTDFNGETARRLKTIENLGSAHFETRHRRKNGSEWFAKVRINYLTDYDRHCFVFISDITQRKLYEKKLRIAAIAFESHDGIMVTDENEFILRVNKSFTRITGYIADEAIGKTPRILSSQRHETSFFSAMWESIDNTGAWDGEFWNRRKNGEGYVQRTTITAVKDSSGKVTNFVSNFNDITQQKDAANQIEQLAFYDPLTNLPNRRLLVNRLQQALAVSKRTQHKGALLFIDLDNFKLLNDTRGHDIGDLLLQMVGKRLGSIVRESDTAARLGGDEFVVMLQGLSEDIGEAAAQTETFANTLLTALNNSYDLKEQQHHITPSIGITLFSDNNQSIEELIKQADIAMYQAKKVGRNTLRFFDPLMQEELNHRATLEFELRKAIENQELSLFYQLQVNRTGAPTGAEALVRWLHPEKGLVSPAKFIPLAEELGLIRIIGHWVIEEACKQLKNWQRYDNTRYLTLSVNVSAKQFRQSDFADQVSRLIQIYKINPKLLKIELTESMLLENIESTIQSISTLKSIGIGFSLDDFGTGYSSLQYLKRLPLDQLKIDQSFVRDLIVDQNDAYIVRTIILLAESLGLEVIAEGVENAEQLSYLADHGCYHYQGYYFSKPVAVEEFENLLRNYA